MNNPQLYIYDNFGDDVLAFSTTRHGGVSKDEYGEFNINKYCGDNADDIQANRQLLAETLGIDESHIVVPHQVHGVDSRMIADEYFSLPENIREMIIDKTDAIMTDAKGVCIGVSTADCIPVLLYDKEHHAACAIHAGWRGTVARIVIKSIMAMRATFGTNSTELKAIIGPGISLKNFEVGQEVYDEFAKAEFDMNAIARMEEKWHIDLPECNRLQLIKAGLKPENITMSGICTFDNNADYFSARRQGINSGRIYTGIVLK
jgi:YfiH family protein